MVKPSKIPTTSSFTAGTQTRGSKARESSVTQKSAIRDHTVEENHVIDWDKAKVVDREAQRQTRWIKKALWIRKTPVCMNRDAESYQLSHTWDQVISRSYDALSCKQSRRDQDVKMFLHYASRLLCMFGKYLYRRLSSRMTYLDYTGWMKFNGANAVSFVVVKHVLENSDNFWKVE